MSFWHAAAMSKKGGFSGSGDAVELTGRRQVRQCWHSLNSIDLSPTHRQLEKKDALFDLAPLGR
jgi:hypothetical protein